MTDCRHDECLFGDLAADAMRYATTANTATKLLALTTANSIVASIKQGNQSNEQELYYIYVYIVYFCINC